MRNILFSNEKYHDEAQLTSGRVLPDDAVEIKQARSFIHRFIPQMLITISLIFAVFFSGSILIKAYDKSAPKTDIKFAVEMIAVFFVCFIILPYVHEIIHALIYPAKAVKNIWKASASYFVYCEAEVSRRRMVSILIMPLLILGLFPYVLWIIFLRFLSAEMTYILLIADAYIILTCTSDIGAIWSTLRFVPKGEKVFSYGVHYYRREKKR